MTRIEKYIEVSFDSTDLKEECSQTKSSIKSIEGIEYKLIKKIKLKPSFQKTLIAIGMILVRFFSYFTSNTTKNDCQFNKTLNDYWTGREVARYKVKIGEASIEEKALSGKVEEKKLAEENQRKNVAEARDAEQKLLNAFNDFASQEKKVAEQALESAEKVSEATKELTSQGENKRTKEADLADLNLKEQEIQKRLEAAHALEREWEEKLTAALVTASEPPASVSETPIKIELESLNHLAEIYFGERIDVVEGGQVRETPYANDWAATAWRTYMSKTAGDLTILKKTVFEPVLQFIEKQSNPSFQEKTYDLMFNALDGLRVLKEDYNKQYGKHSQTEAVKMLTSEVLKQLKSSLWKKLQNPEEFSRFSRCARLWCYLYFRTQESKPTDEIIDLYNLIRTVSSEKEAENQKIRYLERALGVTTPHLDQANALETSVIAAPNPLSNLSTIPYFQRKINLFMALYHGDSELNEAHWKDLLEQFELNYTIAEYIEKNGNYRSIYTTKITTELFTFADQYLLILERKPKGVGILIPTSYIVRNEQGQGGHFAPTSILKGEDGYYLFQHNAGPGALTGYHDNGEEWAGHTTVPLGPYSYQEVKAFIVKGIDLQMNPFSDSEKAIKGFQKLFDKTRIQMDMVNAIPVRPFQHIGNCSVRGWIEWMIFASQRANQVDVMNAFIHFDLKKIRKSYPKAPILQLKDPRFFN